MSCCTLFNRSLFTEAVLTGLSVEVDISSLKNLIPAFNSGTSGLWRPIIVSGNTSNHNYVDLLTQPQTTLRQAFDPFNCSSAITYVGDYNDLEKPIFGLDCSYCNSLEPTDTICCTGSGSCDNRMLKDDYLPKIPLLNQKYLNTFYDWKYHNQFPSVSNKPLGFEHFIKLSNLKNFNITSNSNQSDVSEAKMMIDWSLKERIGEIPYDKETSQYDNIDDHNKAYAKFLQVGKTCGNFILTSLEPDGSGYNPYYPIFSGLIGPTGQNIPWPNWRDVLPTPKEFSAIPYGFNNKTYDNIFVKHNKLGSHWKWNYTSGILGWYRYYQTGIVNDPRAISGVDLYVSPGDVFYATNDGPEYSPYNGNRTGNTKFCPSGLKLIQNNGVVGIVPSGSKFTYISNNLYDRFYSIYTALDFINEEDNTRNSNLNLLSPIEIFELSALLCTSPEYDQITIDLLKRNLDQNYILNEYRQLSGFNSDMSTSKISSISKLDFVQTTGDLITALANKYGAYIWFPPQATTTLEFTKDIDAACYMDLDFDMTVKLSDTYSVSSPGSRGMKDCSGPSFRKNFDYSQSLELANLTLETRRDIRTRYDQTCISGVIEISKAAKMAGVYFNNNLIKEIVYSTGIEHFYAKYPKAEMSRKYSATAANLRIDKAAFHNQGGVYYDSKIFGVDNSTVFVNNVSLNFSNTPRAKIKFTTKDAGIKLYSLKIEKLRGSTSGTYECRAFPNKNSCGCFGLLSFPEYPYICNQSSLVFTNDPLRYTPGLSTANSPTLKSYGGYSASYVSGILGSQTIPNHPAVGASLTSVNKKIDPEMPYGCEQSIQLSLPNYVYSSWSLSLPSYDTVHADIWAQVLENVDLFRTTLSWENPDNPDGGFDSIPNPGYQRFASKVNINDNVSVYDKQKKIVVQKGDGVTDITVKITNPYLLSILENTEYVLYPPNGNSCLAGNIIGGDENILVPIKFSRIPRKQLINFAIPSTTGMGILKRGFFHPNSGLTYNTNLYINGDRTIKNSPIEYSKQSPYISYDKELFNSGSPYNSGSILIGDFTDDVKKILSQIDGFGSHRKPRLYLKLGSRWYEYNTDDTFGFKKDNNTYIGEPYLFKYSSQDSFEKVDGPIIPVSPKGHINFSFLYNFLPSGNKITHYSERKYPFSYNDFVSNPNDIRIAKLNGIRLYFVLGENDSALVTSHDSISQLTEDEQNQITATYPELILANGERWKYRGNGAKNDSKSYALVDYNRLYTNFSDLHIDYNKRNRQGYIYDTRKKCNQTVKIYNKENPSQNYDAKIIEKSLYHITVDKNKNKIVRKKNLINEYRNFYTEIKFDQDIRYSQCYIDFSLLNLDSSNEEGADSFLVYQNQPTLKRETDSLLSNGNYSTKWSDIFSFDGKLTNDLSQYFYGSDYLNSIYPSSLYDNNFFKIIINNADYKIHRYNINLNNNNLFVTHSGLANYAIHQQYNIGLDILTNGSMEDYQNYLSFIDINIPQSGDNLKNGFRDKIQPHLKNMIDNNKIPLGSIKISGILANLGSTHPYEDGFISPTANLFWVNLQGGKLLESAFMINANKTFYTNTLRVDSSPFQLSQINSTTKVNSNGCYKVFYPLVPTNTQTFTDNVLEFDHFKQVPYTGGIFSRLPVYCDTDNLPAGGCSSLACGMNTAGYVSYSGTYNIQINKTKILEDSNNDIPYILSYDAGFYNPIGNKGLKYIQRLELPPYNTLYPASNCDMTSPRPINNRISVLNEEYQQLMVCSIVNDHTALVQNTDILANEMFFRLMYGEKQKINLNTIDNINDSISFKDLIKYNYPKIEAKDVYKNIPYDLDTSADTSNRKIFGTLAIKGILEVGHSITAEIAGKNINISIERQNGKIVSIATVDGKSTSGIIYTESSVTNNLIVSNKILSGYTFLKACVELERRNLGFYHAFTSGKFNGDKDCDGNELTYPWWPIMDRAAWLAIAQAERDAQAARNAGNNDLADLLSRSAQDQYKPYACPYPSDMSAQYYWSSHFYNCSPDFLDAQGRKIPESPFPAGAGGCANTSSAGGPPGWVCTNWGVGLGVGALDSNIYTVLSTKSKKIKLGGIARGIFGLTKPCFVAGGSINLTRNGYGNIEDRIGGAAIASPIAIGSKITSTNSPCGTCYTLDHTDPLTGYKYYDPIRKKSVPPSDGDLEDNCECANWDYGYCRNSNNSSCLCSTDSYDYDEFDYNFEYCRYNISLKSHKRKIKQNSNAISVSAATPCQNTTPGRVIGASLSGGGEVQEEFSFLESSAGAPATWYIHNAERTFSYPAYAPKCPEDLCSIEYDNNTLTIIMPNGPNLCINNTIRNNCPIINITVPDNTYTVSDSIDSSCDNCGVEPNKINMVDQKQNWEIITETRTCILGTILSDGNPNENGPLEMGCQTISCGYCNICCSNQCCNSDYTNCGQGLALKEAPDSFPWSVCITYSEPVVCVGGNDRYPLATVGGCDIPIVYPIVTSNTTANRRYVKLWEDQMKQTRLNTAPCFNNRTINVNDIVEGVVPGSCSDITFTTVVYNGMKYRATMGDPVVGSNPVTFTVASYTYQYRRPKTIQDIFKGDELTAKCNNVVASCPSTIPLNMTEKIKTVDCNTIPTCYDTNIPICDNDNYCCRTGKTSIS